MTTVGRPELLGQPGRLGDEPVVLGQEMVLELEGEAGRGGRPLGLPVRLVLAACWNSVA